MNDVRYDRIGHGYARFRREDPEIAALVREQLGTARTVLNVGAGTGSYEPHDRYVVAVEPSDVMAAQRPAGAVPALRASAGSLPYRDGAFDAALAVLTLHHWGADLATGVRELRRVAAGPVVILTIDAAVSNGLWLVDDYFPGVAELDRQTMPPIPHLDRLLGGGTRVHTVPLGRETPDGMLMSFWGRPELVLEPERRAAASGFRLLDEAAVDHGLRRLSEDLDTGAWDDRHGHLRHAPAHDVGLRLVVHDPSGPI